MSINVLDTDTINQIAAGEVIERPASIVKELLENAIDASSNAITVEIKDGGISFIRITDNGCGILNDDVKTAFLRHATSKIKSVEDLMCVNSLGFRGEALSSIAAVCQVELITKTPNALTGIRYVIEGGKEISFEEIGAPNGTTFIVKNIFFNTPVRRKFLKSNTTEAGYIYDIVLRLALSNKNISIKFINNNSNKLSTPGNDNLKDVIYNAFGRDITRNIICLDDNEFISDSENMSISGYIGKPVTARGNRDYENYYINGRYVKSSIISKAIEDAYKPYIMQHKYPFTVLNITIPPEFIDVNVHPTKMELRFNNQEEVYPFVYDAVSKSLGKKEFIVETNLNNKNIIKNELKHEKKDISHIEPFEYKRQFAQKQSDANNTIYKVTSKVKDNVENYNQPYKEIKQENMDTFLDSKSIKKHKIIGQIFDTYWIIQFEDKMYIIDQHAAHEKVLYEKFVNDYKNNKITNQYLLPPVMLSLSIREEELMLRFMDLFKEAGFVIENFGGREYNLIAVPSNFQTINKQDLFIEMLDSLNNNNVAIDKDLIFEKLASMACKAAVKGNNSLSQLEADELIQELLLLENPYNCPHGRPVIISMSKYELEKKFKRVVD